MNEFTCRTDAKAHKYITDNVLSPNPTLAQYFVGLQAFRFNIEWIPVLRMIADPFLCMVVMCGSEVAMNMKSLVFGTDFGGRLSPVHDMHPSLLSVPDSHPPPLTGPPYLRGP